MHIDDITLLYAYNDWADARTLAACARVSPEQYAAPDAYGHSGLRATMVHILDNIWQQRITLQGYYQEPLADAAAYDATELHEDAFPTFAALRARWMLEQREMQAYIDTLTEATLNSTIRIGTHHHRHACPEQRLHVVSGSRTLPHVVRAEMDAHP